jgi:transcriptional regulator with XRE-family HTH domain
MDIHPDSQELLVRKLRELYTQEITWKEVAERIGVSTAYLNDVVRGKRMAGPKILEPLKLKLIGYYIKTD